MSTVVHLRKAVLKISQAELAEIAKTTQASVSRWENGELSPDLSQLTLIRDEVIKRGLAWDDTWFFEAPESAGAAA